MTYIGCFFMMDDHRRKHYIRNTTQTIFFDTLGMWLVDMIGTTLHLTQTTITYKSDLRDPRSCDAAPDLLLQLQQYHVTEKCIPYIQSSSVHTVRINSGELVSGGIFDGWLWYYAAYFPIKESVQLTRTVFSQLAYGLITRHNMIINNIDELEITTTNNALIGRDDNKLYEYNWGTKDWQLLVTICADKEDPSEWLLIHNNEIFIQSIDLHIEVYPLKLDRPVRRWNVSNQNIIHGKVFQNMYVLFVTDGGLILVYTLNGQFVRKLENSRFEAVSLACSENEIFIADTNRNQVVVINIEGDILRTWSTEKPLCLTIFQHRVIICNTKGIAVWHGNGLRLMELLNISAWDSPLSIHMYAGLLFVAFENYMLTFAVV